MVDFQPPANLGCWYYAGSIYANIFYRFYFGIRILLFHGKRSLHQSLLSHFSALIFILLCLFNGMTIFFFGLGIKTFPYLMVSTYILFLPTPIVRESIARFLNGKFLKYVSILDKT